MLCNELTLTGTDFEIIDINFDKDFIKVLDKNTKYIFSGNFIDCNIDARDNLVSNALGDTYCSPRAKYEYFIKLCNYGIEINKEVV